jgi:D-sedoheptulose 7-phosphate isomerase
MSFVQNYLADLKVLIDQVYEEQVNNLADALLKAWQEDRHVLLMGNGGSAASASHIVNDLQKCIQCDSGKPLKALCLSDNTSLILAWGNDTKFDNIYAPQVECWARPDDLVIGISGSGNSPNVLNAIDTANRLGAFTWGLAGFDGGQLAGMAQKCIIIRSSNMQRIEDMHMILLHMVFSQLREKVRKA